MDIFSGRINEIKVFVYGILVSLQINIYMTKILIVLMFADTAIGMLKHAFLPQLVFSMKELLKGLILKLLLLFIPMIFALTAKAIGFSEFEIVLSVIIRLIIIAETISIYNSYLSLRKGEPIKQTDFIAVMLDKLQSFLKNKFEQIIKIFDNERTN